MRVAVIGLANSKPTKSATSYEYSQNPLQDLEQVLAEIQPQQPNLVVVLAHEPLVDEKHGTETYTPEIAEKFAGQVHVVLGGHAHAIVQNKYINNVLYVESDHYLQGVSKVTIHVDSSTGKVTDMHSELIPLLVEETGEDPQVKAVADALREPGADDVVGATAEKFAKYPSQDNQLDSAVNNWIADLIHDYSGAQIGLHNNGASRIDLPAGIITQRDLLELYPFDDEIIQVKISGQFLQELVEETFGLFTYSGLTISYTQEPGQKPQIAQIRVDNKPLQPNKTYTLATSSFIASGAEGDKEREKFLEIPQEEKVKIGTKTVHTLMKENLANGPVAAPPTGRIYQVYTKQQKRQQKVVKEQLKRQFQPAY